MTDLCPHLVFCYMLLLIFVKHAVVSSSMIQIWTLTHKLVSCFPKSCNLIFKIYVPLVVCYMCFVTFLWWAWLFSLRQNFDYFCFEVSCLLIYSWVEWRTHCHRSCWLAEFVGNNVLVKNDSLNFITIKVMYIENEYPRGIL